MKPTLQITILSFLGLLIAGCGGGHPSPDQVDTESTPSAIKLSVEALENAALTIVEAEEGSIGEHAEAFGEIVLNTDKIASIPARIDGVVSEVSVRLGERVESGRLLAVIESQSLAGAVVTYLSSERDLRFARAELAREKALFEKKLTSSEAFFSKEQAFHQAQIAHAAALQPLEVIDFDEAQLHRYVDDPESANLTRFEIRAPIAGVVTERAPIRGESVTAERELFVVADLSGVWVDFQLPLRDAGSLREDQKVTVGSSAGGETAEATVCYVAPLANETSRTVAARAELSNAEGVWRPGTPVTVGFDRSCELFPVTVPSAAVLDFEGDPVVFVASADGEFELRVVDPGQRDEVRVAIRSGIRAGESVVADGAYQLKAQWGMNAEG